VNLSDNDFLKFYCSSAGVIFNNICSKSEGVFIKDLNHVFCFVSDGYKDQLNPNGTILVEDVLNKKRTKITQDKNIQKLRDEVEADDQFITSNRKTLVSLYVDVYHQLCIIRKAPIINPATDNVVGIIGRVYPFVMPNILDIIYQINDVAQVLTEKAKYEALHYKLTQRQHMVLFLSVYKYSYTEVSEIMTNLGHQISSGRVNEHLENLKYIFAVKSKEALIEKAIHLKYHLFIPRGFLKVGSHTLGDEAVIISEL